MLLRRLLGYHFHVEAVPSGRDALARLASLRPHLILLGLARPCHATYESLEWLSKQPGRRIPAIAFAAGAQDIRLSRAGCAVLPANSTAFATVLEGIRDVLRKHPEALARL